MNQPQCDAYESLADVLGYGGAGGGGKTDLILGLATTRHSVSKIFRREAKQLRDMWERSREIIGFYGKPNENLGTWRNLPGGRRIDLLGVKDDADVEKHRGRPADLFAFDEATEFTETQIRFLLGWNRSVIEGQRCRAVLCFNPPSTTEGQWVLKFFAPWLDEKHPNPAKPGELRWFAMIDGEEVEVPDGTPFPHTENDAYGKPMEITIMPRSRTFIPARVTDNPYFANTTYMAVLQSTPEPLRSQLLKGDFKAGIKDDPWQVIPTEWVKLAQARWVARKSAEPPPTETLDAIGVDVSRGSKDATVVARRYGYWFAPLEKYKGADTNTGRKVATFVLQAMNGDRPPINIDAIGIGSSPYDVLTETEVTEEDGSTSKLTVVAINNSEAADETARTKDGKFKFYNRRAQNYWRFREALDPVNGYDLELPPDSELLADLCAARWELTPRGIKIELKREITKRLKRSPDCADAVVNAYVTGPMSIGGLGLGAVTGWGFDRNL